MQTSMDQDIYSYSTEYEIGETNFGQANINIGKVRIMQNYVAENLVKV